MVVTASEVDALCMGATVLTWQASCHRDPRRLAVVGETGREDNLSTSWCLGASGQEKTRKFARDGYSGVRVFADPTAGDFREDKERAQEGGRKEMMATSLGPPG